VNFYQVRVQSVLRGLSLLDMTASKSCKNAPVSSAIFFYLVLQVTAQTLLKGFA
jgi:hypothetical protein